MLRLIWKLFIKMLSCVSFLLLLQYIFQYWNCFLTLHTQCKHFNLCKTCYWDPLLFYLLYLINVINWSSHLLAKGNNISQMDSVAVTLETGEVQCYSSTPVSWAFLTRMVKLWHIFRSVNITISHLPFFFFVKTRSSDSAVAVILKTISFPLGQEESTPLTQANREYRARSSENSTKFILAWNNTNSFSKTTW